MNGEEISITSRVEVLYDRVEVWILHSCLLSVSRCCGDLSMFVEAVKETGVTPAIACQCESPIL